MEQPVQTVVHFGISLHLVNTLHIELCQHYSRFYLNIYTQTSTWEKPTQPVHQPSSNSAAPANPSPPTVMDQGSDRGIINKLGSGGIGAAVMAWGRLAYGRALGARMGQTPSST
jgi:hypothetical protein